MDIHNEFELDAPSTQIFLDNLVAEQSYRVFHLDFGYDRNFKRWIKLFIKYENRDRFLFVSSHLTNLMTDGQILKCWEI